MEIKREIQTISDYLSAIQELDKSYMGAWGAGGNPQTTTFLYRGISSIDYKLIPSIFRKSHDIDVTINDYIDNNKYTAFASEKQILKEFIAAACAYLTMDPASNSYYRWAEYAQHYGVPTRYLDWTENPLVALYFACKDNKPDYHDKDDLGGKDAAVWMLHLQNYRRFANQTDNIIHGSDQKNRYTIAESINQVYDDECSFRYPIIYKPYYSDPRMSAQSSMFMVWGKEEKPFDDFFNENHELRSNESCSGCRSYYSGQNEEIIFKFSIGKFCKQSLLRELESCGISEKTLFPGLDGIGRYIEMKYRFDIEEAKESF